MKKLIIGLLAAGSIVSAGASALDINGPLNVKLSKAQVEEDKSYFETLGDLYKKGSRPNISKLINKAWVGRCFYDTSPNEPLAAGYIFRVNKKSTEVGPIAKLAYEAVAFININSPDFYDHMKLNDIIENLEAGRVTFGAATILPDSIVLPRNADNSSYAFSAYIKISDKYLVVEARAPEIFSDEEEVYARCYYFIPDYKNN